MQFIVVIFSVLMVLVSAGKRPRIGGDYGQYYYGAPLPQQPPIAPPPPPPPAPAPPAPMPIPITMTVTETETIMMTAMMTETAVITTSLIEQVTMIETTTLPAETIQVCSPITETIAMTETMMMTVTESTVMTEVVPTTVTVTEAVLPTAEERRPEIPQIPQIPQQAICPTVSPCPINVDATKNTNVNNNMVIIALMEEKGVGGRNKGVTSSRVRRPCRYFMLQDDALTPLDMQSVQSVHGLEDAVGRLQEGDNVADQMVDQFLTDIPILTLSTVGVDASRPTGAW